MNVNGAELKGSLQRVRKFKQKGEEMAPVYKREKISLAGNEVFADFGDWGVRLAARDDGVAYRFETAYSGRIRIDGEKASVTVPKGDVHCWANCTGSFGNEETIPVSMPVSQLKTNALKGKTWGDKGMVYLPFAYSVDGTFVVVTESDVRDYPVRRAQG
jgi:hypothetical protein